MIVMLDGQQIGEAAGVASALELGREAAEARQRIIIEVNAAGSPIDPALIDSPPADDAGLGELDLRSAEPGLFVRETLLDALPLVDEIGGEQGRAAEMIQSGDLAKAFEPLQRAVSSWMVLQELIDKACQLTGTDLTSVTLAGERTGADWAGTLARELAGVRDAIGGEDWGGLSDALAYDMDALLDESRGLLTTLADAHKPGDRQPSAGG
ncbi:MAG: hypothetical protein AAF995_06480 [Planctomycetota bacterium]